MNNLFNGFTSGFARTIGRIIAYIFIGFLIFCLLNHFGIDLSKYFKILRW